MKQQLREDLEFIITEDLGVFSSLGIGAAIGTLVAAWAKDKKRINQHCEKQKITDKTKCKAKYRISEINRYMNLIKKGRNDCKNQKNPERCVKSFNQLEQKFKEKRAKWAVRARA